MAANLLSPDFGKSRVTAKAFSSEDMSLVTHKGIYPYEYTDSQHALDEIELPPRDAFNSQLSETHVDDNNYRHAAKV